MYSLQTLNISFPKISEQTDSLKFARWLQIWNPITKKIFHCESFREISFKYKYFKEKKIINLPICKSLNIALEHPKITLKSHEMAKKLVKKKKVKIPRGGGSWSAN